MFTREVGMNANRDMIAYGVIRSFVSVQNILYKLSVQNS